MRSMWRTVGWSLAFSFAIAALVLFLLFRFVLPPRERTAPPSPYTVKEFEGQVAVFQLDQTFPMQVFDTHISTLPEELQQQVQAGIPVEDETQLSLLLEDLTS